MRKLLLAAGALCALLSTGLAATAPAGAAPPPPGSTFSLRGAIAAIANPGATETLTVRGWSVTLAATTTIEMRGGAATMASALNVGDVVAVNGTVTGVRALSAATVLDSSLVDRANGIEGVIRNVVPLAGGLTEMDIQTGRASDDGFIARGIRLSVELSASTPITLPDGTAGSISALTLGRLVRVAGIYDAAARALVAPSYVKLLLMPRDCEREDGLFCRHYIAGRLVMEPSTTAPTTLLVRLGNSRLISVTVGVSTTLLRRYDGASDLTQFSLGDALQINGSFDQTAPRTFNATRIEDVSVQDAFTAATLRLTSFSLATMTGQGRVLRHVEQAPYRNGETITLLFNSGTAVVKEGGVAGTVADLASLREGERIGVSGRYDRVSHLLVVLKANI